MRVLQVNKLYPPVVGGIESVVRQLAEGCHARGHDVDVLVATERGFGTRERLDGVPVRRVGSLGSVLSTPIAPTFPVHLARRARNSDVLHYHLPNPLGVVSHLVARPETPAVATYHSDIVRQSRALRVYRPLLERFLDRVDHIVTTSPRLRDNSAFLRPHREKTTVVPLGIDPAVPDEPPTLADLGVVDDLPSGPVVLFVGRLSYYKGVEYLLDAMSAVDATLLVVGDGPRRDALEDRARELGVAEAVRFLGHVPDETLAACYDRADLFVLPSVEPSEAFGIVQLEAMARGVPVVNTDLPTGVPWVSVDGETGLTVPPRDPDALAAAIDRLLASPDLRATYGENARQRVVETFTRERMIEGTVAVYEDLLTT